MSHNMWTDDIGRCFCDKHRREKCHVCCYDFEMMNRNTEIQQGLRKPPSEIETLAEQRTMLLGGIKFMKDNRQPATDPNMMFHVKELAKVEKRLAELRAAGDGATVAEAVNASTLKQRAHDAEMEAVTNAWAKENPGKTSMEFGGEETQRLYDKFASLPPSAADAAELRDKLVCGYCGKSSATKLLVCSQCRCVAYCDKECQKAAWKGHKKVCKPKETKAAGESDDKEKQKLPLTWEQLEAFGRVPAQGKVLEVRVMTMTNFTREVLECKDRVGAVRRIAAYTDSRGLPGSAAGRVIRWRNPRYHYFMDGSSGARIEQEDLANLTVSDN